MAKRKSIKDEIVTIAEAAEILGVAAVTLRRWDDSGKLKARRHPMSGYRIYRVKDLERLRREILEGRAGAVEPPAKAGKKPTGRAAAKGKRA